MKFRGGKEKIERKEGGEGGKREGQSREFAGCRGGGNNETRTTRWAGREEEEKPKKRERKEEQFTTN